MLHKKEILTAVGTLSIAVAVGFVMQSGETAKERYGVVVDRPSVAQGSVLPTEPQIAPEEFDAGVDGAAESGALLQVEEIKLTSATTKTKVPMMDALVQRVSFPEPADLPNLQSDPVPQISDCDISASARALPGGLVNLSLEAPCAPGEKLAVHHNGMMFSETTDDSGQLSKTVPALAKEAVFILAFANGDGAVAQTTVPDLAQFSRIVLQWRGHTGLELHAREFGADYGEQGHVWSGAPKEIPGVDASLGGFALRLGDPTMADALMAEIYTFPTGMFATSGVVDMSVEAEVTKKNCGRDIDAQTLEMTDGSGLVTRDLTLAVPNCEALGSFMVLNNLVSDLKVASN